MRNKNQPTFIRFDKLQEHIDKNERTCYGYESEESNAPDLTLKHESLSTEFQYPEAETQDEDKYRLIEFVNRLVSFLLESKNMKLDLVLLCLVCHFDTESMLGVKDMKDIMRQYHVKKTTLYNRMNRIKSLLRL